MTQPDFDTTRTNDTADDSVIERQAYIAEGLNPDDPALPEAVARTQRALKRLAHQRGIDRATELAADCALQIDTLS